MTGGLLSHYWPLPAEHSERKFHLLCSWTRPVLFARGGKKKQKKANLCNFRDILLTWRAILPPSAVTNGHARTLSHRAEPKCVHTHTLPGCSVSDIQTKAMRLKFSKCATLAKFDRHSSDRNCFSSVNFGSPPSFIYILLSLSMQSEQGYTNQHLTAVVLIIAPQHWRSSAMHSQRCTQCTSFAWVHWDDFLVIFLSLIFSSVFQQFIRICLCPQTQYLSGHFSLNGSVISCGLKWWRAHRGLTPSWWSFPFSLCPTSNDCSITRLVFGMI